MQGCSGDGLCLSTVGQSACPSFASRPDTHNLTTHASPLFPGRPPLGVLRQAPCPSSPCVPLPLPPPPTRFRGSVGLSSGHSSVLTPLALVMSTSGGFPFTFQWRTPWWRCPLPLPSPGAPNPSCPLGTRNLPLQAAGTHSTCQLPYSGSPQLHPPCIPTYPVSPLSGWSLPCSPSHWLLGPTMLDLEPREGNANQNHADLAPHTH